ICAKAIADAAHRFQSLTLLAQFFTQSLDIDVDRTIRYVHVPAPDAIKQAIACKCDVGILHKELEKLVFDKSQIDGLPFKGYPVSRSIHVQMTERKRSFERFGGRGMATQHDSQTGDQFSRREGLANI